MATSLSFPAFSSSLLADTKYVSATATSAGGNWTIAMDWNATGVPTASDDVIFDWTNNPTLSQFALHTGSGPFVANSLTLGSSAGLGAFSFQSGNTGSTARTLQLTSGGITVTSDVTGTQTFSSTRGILTLDAVDGSFEITNHSSQLLSIAARLSDATVGTTVTINDTSTGGVTLSGANEFTGGLVIRAGMVTAANAAALSSGPVTLGDTSGGSAATLYYSGITIDNDINVRAGSSGLMTIRANGTTTLNGKITLANDLTILKTLSNTTGTFSGGTAGTGNVTLLITGGSMAINGADLNHVGTITEGPVATNSSITISANIGPNVTGIIESNTLASGGVFTVSGAITVGSGGMNIANTTGGRAPVISGGFGGSGDVTFSANGAGNITVSTNSVNHIGTITNNGSGTGTTTISGGVGSNVTTITENSSTGSALTISTTGLTVNSAGTTLINSNTAGAAKLTVSSGITGAGDLILQNNSAIAAGITLSGAVNHVGKITNSGSGSGDSTISGVIGSNVTNLTQNSANSKLITSGVNNAAGGFATGTGTVTISAGTLQVGNASAFGSGNVVSISSGGIFNINTLSPTIGGLSDGTGAGTVTNVSGTDVLTLGNSGNYTFSGVITQTAGSTGITKVGTGTQTLSGINAYTGATTVRAGTLEIKSNASALTQTLGTLAFTGGDVTLLSNKSGAGSLSTTFTTLTARAAGNTGNLVSTGGTNGTDNNINLTQAAGFIDKGIYFNGADFAAMNATNTYVRALAYGTDPNAVAVNTITANRHVKLSSTPGNQAAISLLSLNLSGSGVNWTTTSGNLTVPGIIKSGGGSQSTISGGNLTTSSNAELVIRTDTASDLLAITSNLTQGSGALTKSGAGTLTLSGTNTYTGQTYVNGGILSIGSNVNLGAQATGATLNLRGGTLQATSTFGLYNGSAGTNNRAVVLSDTAGIDVTIGNTLTVAGVISGTGSLTKTNSGTLTVTGANTYTGPTTVTGGTLVVNGSLSAASLVTVATGGTLGGSGSIGSLLVESGGTHGPGNSPGVQTVVGNASYAAGSTFAWELAKNVALTSIQTVPIDFDQVQVNGDLAITSGAIFTLTLNGVGSTVDFTNAFWAANQQWLVFNVGGTGTGNFTLGSITADSLGQNSASYGSFSLANSGGDIVLNWNAAAIPEPSLVSLVGLGLLSLTILRRRRR